MKRPPFFQLTVLLCCSLFGVAAALPNDRLPIQTELAGIKISLREDARRVLADEMKALRANTRDLTSRVERSVAYFPLIETMLAENNIPDDFKFVALLESGLQANASQRGMGFWQWRRELAQDFGLRIDEHIDERKNLHAATLAVCLYLRRNQEVLNNWLSVVATYRSSLKEYNRAVPRDWTFARHLDIDASQRYLLQLLAIKLVWQEQIELFKDNKNSFFPYRLAAGKSFPAIAQELGIAEADIRRYNPWIDSENVPNDKEYVMLIPVHEGLMPQLRQKVWQAAEQTTQAVQPASEDLGFPVVALEGQGPLAKINGHRGIQAQAQDSPASLAERGKISLGKFLEYNDLDEKTPLSAQQFYYLERKDKRAAIPFHTVKEGETLWHIAQMYGLRLERLLAYNRLENVQRMATGRVLWLMKTRPSDVPVEVVALRDEDFRPRQSAGGLSGASAEPVQRHIELLQVPQATLPVTHIQMFRDEEEPVVTAPAVIPTVWRENQHLVTVGQSIYSIARQYGVSPKEICQWNQLKPNSRLQSGQKLRIKTEELLLTTR
jgi:membrane-bound lytic murein transglycosylase D